MPVIVVADDKASSRELIRAALAAAPYTILEAEDGLKALQLVREHTPCLIILDIHMPGMDGIGVIQEMRKDPLSAGIPILALTASAMPEDRRRAHTAGATAYLTKPVGLAQLRREVTRLVGTV